MFIRQDLERAELARELFLALSLNTQNHADFGSKLAISCLKKSRSLRGLKKCSFS